MSETVQTALQTTLKGVTGLADEVDGREHVTRCDPRVLDLGFLKNAIIEPGTFTSDDAAAYQIRRMWVYPVVIAYKFTGVSQAESRRAFVAFRDAVITRLDNYPTLSNTADITVQRLSADEPDELMDKAGGGPYFIVQTINVEILERVTLSGGEYA